MILCTCRELNSDCNLPEQLPIPTELFKQPDCSFSFVIYVLCFVWIQMLTGICATRLIIIIIIIIINSTVHDPKPLLSFLAFRKQSQRSHRHKNGRTPKSSCDFIHKDNLLVCDTVELGRTVPSIRQTPLFLSSGQMNRLFVNLADGGCSRYIPNRKFICTRLHGFTTQKPACFKSTVVKLPIRRNAVLFLWVMNSICW